MEPSEARCLEGFSEVILGGRGVPSVAEFTPSALCLLHEVLRQPHVTTSPTEKLLCRSPPRARLSLSPAAHGKPHCNIRRGPCQPYKSNKKKPDPYMMTNDKLKLLARAVITWSRAPFLESSGSHRPHAPKRHKIRNWSQDIDGTGTDTNQNLRADLVGTWNSQSDETDKASTNFGLTLG